VSLWSEACRDSRLEARIAPARRWLIAAHPAPYKAPTVGDWVVPVEASCTADLVTTAVQVVDCTLHYGSTRELWGELRKFCDIMERRDRSQDPKSASGEPIAAGPGSAIRTAWGVIAAGREESRARLTSILNVPKEGVDLLAQLHADWKEHAQDYLGALEKLVSSPWLRAMRGIGPKIEWECSRAIFAWEVGDLVSDLPDATPLRPRADHRRERARTRDARTREAKAIAFVYANRERFANGEWGYDEICKEVGVTPRTLYRYEGLVSALAALRGDRDELPRGFITGGDGPQGGRLDAIR
jgi:hypothetical protein